MTQNSPSQTEESWVHHCRKLSAQLETTRITLDEYVYNLTVWTTGAPDHCMEECVRSVPPQIRGQYAEFLRSFLEPVDFMPCPKPFMVDTGSGLMLEKKKLELRPKYIRLFMLATEELDKPQWDQP